MKNQKLEYQNTDKKIIILGSVIATLIALSPFLFYLYESVPNKNIWSTFLFEYESKGYKDVNTVMWLLTGKLVPLILLVIWFFTCRHWWYHTLLVPIVMYTYQIIGLFNEDLSYIDELQFFYMLPVMAIIIPSIYLIKAKMFDKLNTANKTITELEEEFTVRPKTIWGKIRQYF
ncbi:hypothetical protein [Oceanihabitans sediminis]|uniref:hypothetical protein n=1 Tax=Oceanihabitans sediminis TaxID=1812012 RepID=UPI002013B81A|nr:hypothetical protein [Oceanihabitans sediminis]